MEQYAITGMSCAACSARVEKAVAKVPGVQSCSVSLLTNSMGVEGSAPPEQIIAAVEKAGYGAALKRGETGRHSGSAAPEAEWEDALADRETPILKRRLIVSLCLSDDVGLAGSAVFPGQSGCDRAVSAVADRHGHGREPEIFYQRLSERDPWRTEYGYARRDGLRGGVPLQRI